MDKYTTNVSNFTTPNEGLVLQVLKGLLTQYNRNPYPTYRKLADMTGLGEVEIARVIIPGLAAKGFIEVIKRPQTSNEYLLLDKALEWHYPKKSFIKSLKNLIKQEKIRATAGRDPMDFIKSQLIGFCGFTKTMLRELYRRIGNVYRYTYGQFMRAWKKVLHKLSRIRTSIPAYFASVLINQEYKEWLIMATGR